MNVRYEISAATYHRAFKTKNDVTSSKVIDFGVRMTSADLGKATMSVQITDVISQLVSVSISALKMPKFASYRR